MSNGTGEGDDWEALLDSGKLDKNLENLKLHNSSNMKVDPFGDALPPMGRNQGSIPLSSNLSDPSYSGPVRILTNGSRNQYRKPEPTLKILKRPETQTTRVPEPQTQKNTMKSLEQREAEYAEARQRILGNEAGGAKPSPGQHKQNGKKTDGGRKSVNGDVRTPKGPDGSKGFNNRR